MLLKVPVCLEVRDGAVASAHEKSCRHVLDTSLVSALPKGVEDVLFESGFLLKRYESDCVVTV